MIDSDIFPSNSFPPSSCRSVDGFWLKQGLMKEESTTHLHISSQKPQQEPSSLPFCCLALGSDEERHCHGHWKRNIFSNILRRKISRQVGRYGESEKPVTKLQAVLGKGREAFNTKNRHVSIDNGIALYSPSGFPTSKAL
uniref:Uncharacterized protein n=1 Tax=Salix viminalis TaxID=40686 RepID=A0A6N2L370_SALVM